MTAEGQVRIDQDSIKQTWTSSHYHRYMNEYMYINLDIQDLGPRTVPATVNLTDMDEETDDVTGENRLKYHYSGTAGSHRQ
jgi:hypothetical protein